MEATALAALIGRIESMAYTHEDVLALLALATGRCEKCEEREIAKGLQATCEQLRRELDTAPQIAEADAERVNHVDAGPTRSASYIQEAPCFT